MHRYLCPHCHASLDACAFEFVVDARQRWLACPACDGLIPLPSDGAAATDAAPSLEAPSERTDSTGKLHPA